MKALLTAFVSGLSGKSGDAVAANWKGIQVIRRRVIPKNPKSAAQVAQRALMARMAAWWRSLPSDLTTFINAHAVGTKMSGFNRSSKQNLDDLVAGNTPAIVPGNPTCSAVQAIADATSTTDAEIDITWDAGAAPQTYYVHIFTCPDDPAEIGLVEPDVWTMYGTPVLVSAEAAAAIPVANIAKLYYVVAIVADTNDLATATIISGGTAATATSGETV